MPLSVDHKPNLREERLRIEDAGGVVVWAGTWRVSGVLAVSRAFGELRGVRAAALGRRALCSRVASAMRRAAFAAARMRRGFCAGRPCRAAPAPIPTPHSWPAPHATRVQATGRSSSM